MTSPDPVKADFPSKFKGKVPKTVFLFLFFYCYFKWSDCCFTLQKSLLLDRTAELLLLTAAACLNQCRQFFPAGIHLVSVKIDPAAVVTPVQVINPTVPVLCIVSCKCLRS